MAIHRVTRLRHLGSPQPPEWLSGAQSGDVVECAPGKWVQLVPLTDSESKAFFEDQHAQLHPPKEDAPLAAAAEPAPAPTTEAVSAASTKPAEEPLK